MDRDERLLRFAAWFRVVFADSNKSRANRVDLQIGVPLSALRRESFHLTVRAQAMQQAIMSLGKVNRAIEDGIGTAPVLVHARAHR